MSKLIVLFALCSLLVTGIVAKNKQCKCNFPANSPVCGNNGKTYNNREELECFNKCHNKNEQVKVEGACPSCDCSSNKMLLSVCGSDGRTYMNPSVVSCRNKCLYKRIKIAKKEKCKAGDKALDTFIVESSKHD